ncbi:MAG TPA: copper-binding protein [Candidatus Sulfotelmatobacter sp.]|nr:copper-binding protein [Candidatus Sulfotelmatobacter sp.]
MVTPVLAALLAVASPYTADVHGNVVAVDRARGTVTLHHHAHVGMEMEMTMVVRLRDPRQPSQLKIGQFVHLRCDERTSPWVCVKG